MKALTFLPAVCLALALAAHADTPPDLVSPKAEAPHLYRVILYIPGSPRLIDYPDVEKLLCCERDRIAFETKDGSVVMHQGPFTVIESRQAPSRHSSSGPRFYDPR